MLYTSLISIVLQSDIVTIEWRVVVSCKLPHTFKILNMYSVSFLRILIAEDNREKDVLRYDQGVSQAA